LLAALAQEAAAEVLVDFFLRQSQQVLQLILTALL
tara:strand:- start:533 stop:637 length:105 start_codon:yes stop_codon:yes gene_type:complete